MSITPVLIAPLSSGDKLYFIAGRLSGEENSHHIFSAKNKDEAEAEFKKMIRLANDIAVGGDIEDQEIYVEDCRLLSDFCVIPCTPIE